MRFIFNKIILGVGWKREYKEWEVGVSIEVERLVRRLLN